MVNGIECFSHVACIVHTPLNPYNIVDLLMLLAVVSTCVLIIIVVAD